MDQLSNDDLDSILYTTDLSLLSTDTLKRTVKYLKNQTRNLRKPDPTLHEKIEDVEFFCFSSEKSFENFSKFEVKDVSEKILQHKLIEEKGDTSPSQLQLSISKARSRRQNPYTKRSQATIPFREQFDYHTDFLDEDIYEDDADFEADFITDSITPIAPQPIVANRKKQKSNVVFINNAQPKPSINIFKESVPITHVKGKKRLLKSRVNSTNKQGNPNKRMKVSLVHSKNINKPYLYPSSVNDKSIFLPDESEIENKVTETNSNGIRRFEKLVPEMLCDVNNPRERRSLYNQFFKIVTKIYNRCRVTHSQRERYRKTLVKQIKGEDAIKEIKKQLRPVRQIVLNHNQTLKSTSPVISYVPPLNGVSPRIITPHQKLPPQFVNKKLVYSPQVIKPVASSNLNTQANRVAVSNLTGFSPTVINSGNIKLAPSPSAKQLIIKPMSADGKTGPVGKPSPISTRFYILKSSNGQSSTLVPMSGSPTMSANGQPVRLTIKPTNTNNTSVPVSLVQKTLSTPSTATVSNSLNTSNSLIRVNNLNANNSIKLVLNPSGQGNPSNTNLMNLNNLKNNTFRISPSASNGAQHILIGGNKISNNVGAKVFAIKPTVSTANVIPTFSGNK